MDDKNKNTEFEFIKLLVLDQNDDLFEVGMGKKYPMKKLMKKYCAYTGLNMLSLLFRFNGNTVNKTDTPASLNMVEYDIVEVFQQQTGGLGC